MKHKRTKFGQATTGRLLAVAAMLCLTANGARAQADHKTLFFISDSHLDTQWNWDVRTTIGEYVHNTMTQISILILISILREPSSTVG